MYTNYSLIFFCQRCQQGHNRTQESMFDKGVRCNHNGCGGWVITPSGRSNIKVTLNAGVYMVRGSETSVWIGAKNRDDAAAHFSSEYDEDIAQVVKLDDEAIRDTTFTYDAEGKGLEKDFVQVSAIDVLVANEELPKVFYFIDNEVIDEASERVREAKERNNDGFGNGDLFNPYDYDDEL